MTQPNEAERGRKACASAIEVETMLEFEVDEAADTYVEYFLHLVGHWYSDPKMGKWLYRDMMHLMWLANPDSSFVPGWPPGLPGTSC